eukprot:403371157
MSLYLGSSIAGIIRTLIGFPIEHPLDSIKTQWQAKPYHKNEAAIIKDIYQTKGFKGFYAGALPNIVRCLLKNATRYPLMVGLPNFYKNQLPDSFKEHKAFLKLLTGCSIALVEATMACPIERLKVYFMTTNENISYKQFFQNNQHHLMKELFRGFGPLFARQSMAWTVFLQSDLLVRTTIRKVMKYDEKEQIPSKFLVPASIIVALLNTTLVMPFDCVKTHMEKRDPTNTYINTFKNIYRQGGMLSFFTGYRIRFFMYFINSLFVVNLLEKLESIAHFLRSQN